MKRISLSTTILVLSVTGMLFTACRKNDTKNSPGTKTSQTAGKVNAWLESKKVTTQPNKSATIESLKNNLDFTRSRYEPLSDDAQFLYIPVKEEFRKLKNVDEKSTPFLLLVLDKSGNITKGNLVLYTPENGSPVDEIPGQTFNKIYNNKPIECNGRFRFLSVTGTLLYDLGFKDGKASSQGRVQKGKTRKSESNVDIQSTVICVDWYLVTTYYGPNGVINQTEEYLGTTCMNSGCDDPDLQSLCPYDDGLGGGGGTGGNDCCIPDQNIQWTAYATSSDWPTTCGTETVTNGIPTRTCQFKWDFYSHHLLFWNWTNYVMVQADFEKIGGVWKFKEVHPVSGVDTEGETPPCTNFTCTATDIRSISADKSKATIELRYNIYFSVPCLSSGTQNRSGTMTQHWSAPQQ